MTGDIAELTPCGIFRNENECALSPAPSHFREIDSHRSTRDRTFWSSSPVSDVSSDPRREAEASLEYRQKVHRRYQTCLRDPHKQYHSATNALNEGTGGVFFQLRDQPTGTISSLATSDFEDVVMMYIPFALTRQRSSITRRKKTRTIAVLHTVGAHMRNVMSIARELEAECTRINQWTSFIHSILSGWFVTRAILTRTWVFFRRWWQFLAWKMSSDKVQIRLEVGRIYPARIATKAMANFRNLLKYYGCYIWQGRRYFLSAEWSPHE